MSEGTVPGFFGKLPCNGDFLQRRVATEFVERWDDWLQGSIAASRQALGEGWLRSYLAAPLWRFVLTEGACGSAAYAGVLSASVDRVGRYFPIVLVLQIDVDWNPLDLAVCWSRWFDALEACILDALERQDLRLEEFEAALAAVVAPTSITVPASVGGELFANSRFPAAGPRWQVTLPSPEHLQLDVVALAYRELSRALRPVTLWWTAGSPTYGACWLASQGMPPVEGFQTLLDGSAPDGTWECANPRETTLRRSAAAESAPPPAADGTEPVAAPQSIVATRLPTDRPSDVEGNRVAFVVRPEAGLWAIVVPHGAAPVEATRMVADALQSVAAAGSLSALVESLRATLLAVNRQLNERRSSSSDPGAAHVLVLAKNDSDCALVCAGETQALRLRGGAVSVVAGGDGGSTASADNGDLLSLVQSSRGPSEPCGSAQHNSVVTTFERTFHGDEWLLCGGRFTPLPDPDQLHEWVGPTAEGTPRAPAMLLQVQAA